MLTFHDLPSNQVLAAVADGLVATGFLVETGKKFKERISVPVLFGLNGRLEKSFDADAYHENAGFVLEVEAGRAVINNQFLKDLFQACMMSDVRYLAVAVRNTYARNPDFQNVLRFFDTLYASNRLRLPLEGILSEYEHIENKQSLNEWREVVESVAAFATASGGSVYIGIAPGGQRVGVQIGRGTLEGLTNNIKINTHPPQYPSITLEGDEASAILVLRVEESPIKPVWALTILEALGVNPQRLKAVQMEQTVDLPGLVIHASR